MIFRHAVAVTTALTALCCGPDVTAVRSDAGGVGGSGSSTSAGGQGGGGAAATATASTATGAGGLAATATGAGGSAGCAGAPDEDLDGDGFTPLTGDCNECDPLVNPAAFDDLEPPDEPQVDDDCNGTLNDPPPPCDDGIVIDDADPFAAARAVELCQKKETGWWGVVDAKWVLSDGSPPPAIPAFDLGHGVLPSFGTNVPQAGSRVLALSSGAARAPGDPGFVPVEGYDKGYLSAHPDNFPKMIPPCNAVAGEGHDAAGLEVSIATPSNANGFSFDFTFFAADWPTGVCTPYDDAFVAMLSPVPMGLADGDVAFDGQLNPVTLNAAWFDSCGCPGGPPCIAGGKLFSCPMGTTALDGTGFEGHGATAWLRTSVPAEPNSTITIRWAAYDAGDGLADSTVLVDNWMWLRGPQVVSTSLGPPGP